MQLMQLKLWTVLAACLCGTSLLSIATAAEPKEKLKGVETQALLKRPQNYWSVGITYRDKVLGVDGKDISILEKSYYSVELEELGLAYASAEGLAQIRENGLDREYLLSGTVLHDRKGLFRKTDQYYVIILEATPAVITDTEEVESGLDQLSLADGHPATQHMLDLFSTTQRDLINLSKELEVPLEELFDLDSKNSEKAKDIVRRALRKIEVSQDMPSSEILSGFIFHMLSRKLAQPPPEPDEAFEITEEAIDDTEADSEGVSAPSEGNNLEDELPAPIRRAPIIALDQPPISEELTTDEPELIPGGETIQEEAIPAEPIEPTETSPSGTDAASVESEDPIIPPEETEPGLPLEEDAGTGPEKIEAAPIVAEVDNDTDPDQAGEELFTSEKEKQTEPVTFLDPELINAEPVGKTIKPRLKAKISAPLTSPDSNDNNIFAPVGK